MKYISIFILSLLLASCNFFEALGTKPEAAGVFRKGFHHDGGICENYYGVMNPAEFGTGTPSDPYIIVSPEQLLAISQQESYWSASFIQQCNIDMGEVSSTFTPIGNSTTPFTGTYDGGYFEISWLYLNPAASDYTGFFGLTNGATIKNIAFTNSNIYASSYNYIGIAIGKAENSVVSEIYVNGYVEGGSRVGGIMGATDNGGSYSRLINDANVIINSSYGGGIVGSHGDTINANSISISANYGYVSSSSGSYIGGIAGAVFNSSTIVESAHYGDVSGGAMVGGIAGQLSATASISNSITTGNIFCTSACTTDLGGAAGQSPSSSVISNFTWINNSSDQAANCYYNATSTTFEETGCTETATPSDLYGTSNSPLNAWDPGLWYISGSDYPKPYFYYYFNFGN